MCKSIFEINIYICITYTNKTLVLFKSNKILVKFVILSITKIVLKMKSPKQEEYDDYRSTLYYVESAKSSLQDHEGLSRWTTNHV